MKKIKASITRVLIIGMVISLALSSAAFAAMPTELELNLDSLSSSSLITLKRTVENNLEIAKTYAYLDVSEMTPGAKAVVLSARENIIFHESWVNTNESSSAVVKDKEGNILYILPAFQDVFPEDWAIPVENASAMKAKTLNASQALAPQGAVELSVFENVYVSNPSPTVDTPCFGQVTSYVTADAAVGTWAYSGTGTVNLGITNIDTGVSVAFVANVAVNDALWAAGTAGVNYGARASTWGTPQYMNFAMGAAC
jgi:hypothetical protein